MNPILFRLLLFLGLALSSLTTYAEIWPTQNRWDQRVELNCTKWPLQLKVECEGFVRRVLRNDSRWSDIYSAWVKEFWHKEIYSNPSSPLAGIATDCADASYGMRIYFSWLFNLEFKIKYPGFPGRFITNTEKSFNSIRHPEQRLKSFLVWLNRLVSTRSLPDDTYPIELSEKYFRPGILFNTTTHTIQMVEMDPYGVGVFLYSTVPLQIRELKELFDYPSALPSDRISFLDGFRSFIEPQDYGKPIKQLPGYSLEQFNFLGPRKHENEKQTLPSTDQIGHFYEKLQARFQTKTEPIGRKVSRILQAICSQVRERNELIRSAISLHGKACIKSKMDYDEFSTPFRDRELRNLFLKGQHLYSILRDPEIRHQALNSTESSTALKEYELFVIDTIFGDTNLEIKVSEDWSDHFCQLEAMIKNPENRQLTLRKAWQKIRTDSLVSDPHAGFYQRWGIEPYEQKCPVPKN